MPAEPKFYVENVGTLSFPLSESQAQALIKVCTQALYGIQSLDSYFQIRKIDLQVRDSYELDVSLLKIESSEWNKKLNLLARRITKEMGRSDDTVKVNLCKIILFKKGGHFVKHRDYKKEVNMFATLIIQLPSEYTGGELIVYFEDKQKYADFGQSTGK